MSKRWIAGVFCAVISLGWLHASQAVSFPEKIQLQVPFFADDTAQCGPATLAAVLSFWGKEVNPAALRDQLYKPNLKGTLPIDMILIAQSYGTKADVYEGSLEDLRQQLSLQKPLILLLNLGVKIYPKGHYVVATGYDEARQGVVLHSGLERDVFVPYKKLEKAWKRTNHWTLRVEPSPTS